MSLKIMVSASMNAHLVFSKLNFLLPGSPGQIYCPWPKKGFFFLPHETCFGLKQSSNNIYQDY